MVVLTHDNLLIEENKTIKMFSGENIWFPY